MDETKVKNKTTIVIALGSNTCPKKHISLAKQHLRNIFPDIVFSRDMQTKAIGKLYHRDFVNCVAVAHSEKEADIIVQLLKRLEKVCGDEKGKRDKGYVQLDADLLLCHGTMYHIADWNRHYIISLLADMEKDLADNVPNPLYHI